MHVCGCVHLCLAGLCWCVCVSICSQLVLDVYRLSKIQSGFLLFSVWRERERDRDRDRDREREHEHEHEGEREIENPILHAGIRSLNFGIGF